MFNKLGNRIMFKLFPKLIICLQDVIFCSQIPQEINFPRSFLTTLHDVHTWIVTFPYCIILASFIRASGGPNSLCATWRYYPTMDRAKKSQQGLIKRSPVTGGQDRYANTSLTTIRQATRGIAFAIRNGMWQRAACWTESKIRNAAPVPRKGIRVIIR